MERALIATRSSAYTGMRVVIPSAAGTYIGYGISPDRRPGRICRREE